MKFHPLTKQSSCDSYYLGICKEVFQIIQNEEYEGIVHGIKGENLKDFACFLTCYFEDIVSETRMWQAFTSAHQELYGKHLPFYKLDEYYPDEINPQDIHFLIWYFISGKFLDEYLSPTNRDLIHLGHEIYEIFDREYENAPENIKLKTFLTISENEIDYYKIRNTIDWLFINSYLFHFQEYEFEREMQEVLNSEDEELIDNAEAIADDFRDFLAVSQSSNLLAFRGKDWLARVLGKDHALYNEIINLDKRKTGYFLYKGEDGQNIILQHIATDKVLKVTKKSIDVLPEFKKNKTIFHINLIKWKNEWWFSGSYTTVNYNDKLLKDEKESVESVLLFDDHPVTVKEDFENQYNSFLKFNHNKPIAFFGNGSQIRNFLHKFIQFHNSKLNLNSQKKDVSGLLAKETSLLDIEINDEKFPESLENLDAILYFEKNKGLYFVFGFADVIPDEDNKLYNSESKTDIMDFFFSPTCRPDFVNYIIKNYPTLIQKYELKTGENFLHDNLDFLLRFWKHETYN